MRFKINTLKISLPFTLHQLITILVLIFSVFFANNASCRVPEVVLKQKDAVVTIYVMIKGAEERIIGSGFIVDKDGIVVTNYHVISQLIEETGYTGLIKLQNGAFFFIEELLGIDKENDIAVFRVEGSRLPAVRLSRVYKPKQGDSIVVIGSPLGLETTVSDGIISSIRGKEGIIQITAPISGGSSGSPVFNVQGEVIGVATMQFVKGQNLNFAYPIRYAISILSQYKRTGKPLESVARPQSVPTPKVSQQPKEQPKGKPDTAPQLTAQDWIAKGTQFRLQGKYPEAIDAYTKAIELDPYSPVAYNNRGLVYSFQGLIQQAINDYSRAIALAPKFAVAYYNRGSSYVKINKNEFALEDFNKAIELNPSFDLAYENRCDVYIGMGKHQLALEDCNRAIELNLSNTEVFANRCLAYSHIGDYRRAIDDCSKSIQLDQKNVGAHNVMGNIYFRLRDYPTAVTYFSKAIELKPNLPAAYATLCVAYAGLDKYGLALTNCDEAIRLKPAYATAYNNRCYVYNRLGKHQLALDDCNRAIELDPKLVAAYENRFMSYNNLGNKDKAREDTLTAAKLGSKEAQDFLNKSGIRW